MGEYESLVRSSCGGDVCEHGASLDQVSLFQNISVKSFFKIVQTIIIMRMKNTPADYTSMLIRISNSEVGVITCVFRRHKLQTGYHISSFKHHDAYEIPEVSGAAYIGRKRLLEGGVYICVNVLLLIRKVLEKRIKKHLIFRSFC